MRTLIDWEFDELPPLRGKYLVLFQEDGKLPEIKTAHWSPSSGLWFCECTCITVLAWASEITHF